MHIIHICNGDFTSHLTSGLLGGENYPHFTHKNSKFLKFLWCLSTCHSWNLWFNKGQHKEYCAK